MGHTWPQTIPNGKQHGRFQAKYPERSMVAARKPWDAPGLKLLQKLAKSRMFHGSRPQTMGRAWPQTIPNGKQPRRFQAKNPECSMVAARKPWDMPGLKQL